MFDYKEVVLPADASEKSVAETLKEECQGGWTVERKEAGYRGDLAFNLYVLKKDKQDETLEEQMASRENSGLSTPDVKPVPEPVSAPEPAQIYRPAGNF